MTKEKLPIEDHPLQRMCNQTAAYYLDMLCMLYRCIPETIPEQTYFLSRLILTGQPDSSLEQKLAVAETLTTQQLETFIQQLQEHNLCSYFAMDAILLLRLRKSEPSELNTLGTLLDYLGLSVQEVSCIAALSVAVLEQDECKFYAFSKYTQEQKQQFAYLFPKDSNGTRFFNSSSCSIYGEVLNAQSRNRWLGKRHICITNCVFDFANFSKQIFSQASEVRLSHCTFNGRKLKIEDAVQFMQCDCIKIQNCKFVDFNGTILSISKGQRIEISQSCFENCAREYASREMRKKYQHVWLDESIQSEYGSLIHADDDQQLYLTECIFTNCGVHNLRGNDYCYKDDIQDLDQPLGVYCMISNCLAYVTHCTFDNCEYIGTIHPRYWCSAHGWTYVAKKIQDSSLFSHLKKQQCNTLCNCARLSK